jgi:hypothetical protein
MYCPLTFFVSLFILQLQTVDGMLNRLAKAHPYSEYFWVPHLLWRPDMYSLMLQRGVKDLSSMKYGLRTIQADFFKNDKCV